MAKPLTCLLVTLQNGSETTEAVVTDTQFFLGRSPDCAIVLRSPSISRHHLLVKNKSGKIWIEDQGSANGTTVNGTAIAGKRLTPVTPDDEIVLGNAIKLTLEPMVRVFSENVVKESPLNDEDKESLMNLIQGAHAEAKRLVESGKEIYENFVKNGEAAAAAIEKKMAANFEEVMSKANTDAEALVKIARADAVFTRQKAAAEAEEMLTRAKADSASMMETAIAESTAMVEKARKEREELVSGMREEAAREKAKECERMVDEARKTAAGILEEARTNEAITLARARKLEAELVADARKTADKHLADAKKELDKLKMESAAAADKQIFDAKRGSADMIADAKRLSAEMTADAKSLSEKLVADARKTAAGMLAEAKHASDDLVTKAFEKSEAEARDRRAKFDAAMAEESAEKKKKLEDEFKHERERLEHEIAQLRVAQLAQLNKERAKAVDDWSRERKRIVREIMNKGEAEALKHITADSWRPLAKALESGIEESLETTVKSENSVEEVATLVRQVKRGHRFTRMAWTLQGFFAGVLIWYGAEHAASFLNGDVSPLQAAVEEETKRRQEELAQRKFEPEQDDVLRETYTDSVLHTREFTHKYLAEDFQKHWLKKSSMYFLKSWRVDEDKVVAVIAKLNALVSALEEAKHGIHPDFVKKGIQKMNDLETATMGEVKDLLGSNVRVEALKKLEKETFTEFHSERTPAASGDEN